MNFAFVDLTNAQDWIPKERQLGAGKKKVCSPVTRRRMESTLRNVQCTVPCENSNDIRQEYKHLLYIILLYSYYFFVNNTKY